MKKQQFLSSFVGVAILTAPLLGWSFAATGHHLVAQVCELELTTATRQAVSDLLTSQTLAEVSTWADEERTRDRSTSTWHYVDYNIKSGRIEPEHAKDPTILDAISSNSVALRRAESTLTRQRALKFLVHFIGDLHQPLHCADNNDAGGNKTQVILGGKEERLHRVWDGPIVENMLTNRYSGKPLDEVATLLHQKYLAQKAAITSGTPESWARESHEIAKNHVYNLPPASDNKPPLLTEEYLRQSDEVIERQLAKAGFRLAHLLNLLLDADYAQSLAKRDQGGSSLRSSHHVLPKKKREPVGAGVATP